MKYVQVMGVSSMALPIKFPALSMGPLSWLSSILFIDPLQMIYQISRCTGYGFFDMWGSSYYLRAFVGLAMFPTLFTWVMSCLSTPKFVAKYGIATLGDRTHPATMQFFFNMVYIWMSTFAVKHTIQVLAMTRYLAAFMSPPGSSSSASTSSSSASASSYTTGSSSTSSTSASSGSSTVGNMQGILSALYMLLGVLSIVALFGVLGPTIIYSYLLIDALVNSPMDELSEPMRWNKTVLAVKLREPVGDRLGGIRDNQKVRVTLSSLECELLVVPEEKHDMLFLQEKGSQEDNGFSKGRAVIHVTGKLIRKAVRRRGTVENLDWPKGEDEAIMRIKFPEGEGGPSTIDVASPKLNFVRRALKEVQRAPIDTLVVERSGEFDMPKPSCLRRTCLGRCCCLPEVADVIEGTRFCPCRPGGAPKTYSVKLPPPNKKKGGRQLVTVTEKESKKETKLHRDFVICSVARHLTAKIAIDEEEAKEFAIADMWTEGVGIGSAAYRAKASRPAWVLNRKRTSINRCLGTCVGITMYCHCGCLLCKVISAVVDAEEEGEEAGEDFPVPKCCCCCRKDSTCNKVCSGPFRPECCTRRCCRGCLRLGHFSAVHPKIIIRFHANFRPRRAAWWFVKFFHIIISGTVATFLPVGLSEFWFLGMLVLSLLMQLYFNPYGESPRFCRCVCSVLSQFLRLSRALFSLSPLLFFFLPSRPIF